MIFSSCCAPGSSRFGNGAKTSWCTEHLLGSQAPRPWRTRAPLKVTLSDVQAALLEGKQSVAVKVLSHRERCAPRDRGDYGGRQLEGFQLGGHLQSNFHGECPIQGIAPEVTEVVWQARGDRKTDGLPESGACTVYSSPGVEDHGGKLPAMITAEGRILAYFLFSSLLHGRSSGVKCELVSQPKGVVHR